MGKVGEEERKGVSKGKRIERRNMKRREEY